MDSLLAGLLCELTKLLGRGVACIVSLGKWRGERFKGQKADIYAAAGSIWFRREGQVVFTDTGLLFIGIMLYCACVFGLLIFYS